VLVVGFDLDMTLIDSRPGIAAAYRALSEQTGVYVDIDAAVARLGPPLEWEIGHWFPAERVSAAVAAYRLLYPRYAIEPSRPLPGARDALAAVRAAGGRVVVVTAKKTELARLHLDRLGLKVDGLAGPLRGPGPRRVGRTVTDNVDIAVEQDLGFWAEGKARALTEHAATVYVGDHTLDMVAARAARVVGVGVATGPCTADELRRAGADAVLAGLDGFAAWLRDGS
jgi:phosphoglycolate phosphatase